MDLTIPFLGAQLVLVLLLWTVYSVVRRSPNLVARLRTLDDVTDVEMWIKHGLDELRRSLTDLAGLRDRKGKLEQRSRASRGLGVGWAQRIFMLAFLGGTWLLLYESESAIGVILNLTSGFLSLSREQAAFVGPLLAVGAFMITHTASLAAHKPERARRTWRWACSGTLVTLLLVAGMWIVFLSGRTVDVSDAVATTTMEGTLTRTLYLLGLLNAVAAAFAGTGILLLLEDRFVATEIERAERLMRSLTQHVLHVARELREHNVTLPDEMQRELERLADVAEPPPASAGPRRTAPVVTVASSILLLLLAAAAEAQPARNAPVPPSTSTAPRPARPAPATSRDIRLPAGAACERFLGGSDATTSVSFSGLHVDSPNGRMFTRQDDRN